jgi:hypothetical protein
LQRFLGNLSTHRLETTISLAETKGKVRGVRIVARNEDFVRGLAFIFSPYNLLSGKALSFF